MNKETSLFILQFICNHEPGLKENETQNNSANSLMVQAVTNFSD